MEADRQQRAKELLYEVVGLGPSERARRLDEQCGSDAELRREVESLLEHLEQSDLPDLWEPQEEDADDKFEVTFENYDILEELGRGGQGVVYLAEDLRLHRRVALKVLTGMAARSRSMRSRLKREAEAASKLDHPAICSVFEVGEEGGVPFIAMRYVEGESLARRIAAKDGGTRESGQTTSTGTTGGTSSTGRSALFEEVRIIERVAHALHAAHEAALIHRDVKPGNIMVTRDGDPVLLDFGLAHDEETDAPALTATGQIMGTPAYMAPEQITGDRARVDRRTDVYALAVTLYEAVTLQRPFEGLTREHLYQKIISSDPTDPRRLNPSIPTDLKAVLEVALDKEPDRRYQTAAAFADDLRRVRETRPIRARPAGALVKMQRWARRRPAAAILLLVLAIGVPLLAALGGYLLASRDVIERGREAAKRQRVHALLEQALIQQAVDHDPAGAIRSLQAALAIEPDAPVALFELATTYLIRVRQPEKALAILDRHRALESAYPALLRARAMALRALDRNPEAEEVERRVKEPVSAFDYYAAGIDMRYTRSDLDAEAGARAVDLLTQAVFRASESRGVYLFLLASSAAIAADTEVTLRATRAFEPRLAHIGAYLRGLSFSQARDLAGATRHYEAAVRLRPDFVAAIGNLAACHQQLGKLDSALTLTDRVLALDPDQLRAHINRRSILVAQLGRQGAIDYYRKRIAPDRAWDHFNLGALLHQQRDPEAAIPHFRVAVSLKPEVFDAQYNLGICLAVRGEFEQAIQHYRKAIELRWNDARLHTSLGHALERSGDLDGALREYEHAIRIDPRFAAASIRHRLVLARKLGTDGAIDALETFRETHPDHAWTHINLGVLREAAGDQDAALDHYREAVRTDPDLHAGHNCLGGALLRAGDYTGAIAACRRAAEIDPDFPNAYQGLRVAYLEATGLQQAADAFEELVEANPDHAHAHFELGILLFHIGDAAGADRHLRQAVRLAPNLVDAHVWLGKTQLCLGDLDAAITAFAKARRLAPGHREAGSRLQQLHDLMRRESTLAAVSAGAEHPDSPRERLRLAELAGFTERFFVATRLFRSAFDESPGLASTASPNQLQSYRWCAAAAAARAASTANGDSGRAADPPPDALRRLAVSWLREDLDALRQRHESREIDPSELRRILEFWRRSPDLECVRDADSLLLLPTPEQAACMALWADVDRLRTEAGPGAPK